MTSRRSSIAAALATVILVAVAACGSGSDASSSDTTTATSAAVKELSQDPTSIPITTPLPQKPEPGGTVALFTCEVPACKQEAEGLHNAAEAVGWKVVDIPFVTTDASTLAPAFRQAIAAKPTAIVLSGTPYELWSRYVPEVEKIGAIIVPMFTGPVPVSKTVPAISAGPVSDRNMAAKISRWVTDDSDGTAHVLVQRISAYKAVAGWADAVKKELADICPTCKVSEIDNSADQITGAGAAQSIVSQVRRDPSIDYVIGFSGAFSGGLNQALANAQLKVKVGGLFPLPQNVQDIQRGSGGAFLTLNSRYATWFAMDAALRHAQGAPMLSDDKELVLPSKLVTKASAKDSDGNFLGPEGFEEQFAKLWKVD